MHGVAGGALGSYALLIFFIFSPHFFFHFSPLFFSRTQRGQHALCRRSYSRLLWRSPTLAAPATLPPYRSAYVNVRQHTCTMSIAYSAARAKKQKHLLMRVVKCGTGGALAAHIRPADYCLCVLILLYVSCYCYICVRIPVYARCRSASSTQLSAIYYYMDHYMCPHTAIYVSSH